MMTPIVAKLPLRTLSAATMSDAPSRVSGMTARWTTVPQGIVGGGEIVLLALKPSLWKPLFDSAAWLVTGTALALIFVLTQRTWPGLSVNTTARLALLLGVVRFALAVLQWCTTWHLLTNLRIIDIGGIRTPAIRSCMLVHVRNTYLRCTAVEKLYALGSITFVSDEPSRPPHHWSSIAKPHEVHTKVRRAIENALDHCSF